MTNLVFNSFLALVLIGSFVGAIWAWARSSLKKDIAEKKNKANEETNETHNRIIIDTKYRDRIRRMFDTKR